MTKFNLVQLEHLEASVKRELSFRRYCYPIWVKDQNKPTFTEKKASKEIILMEKVLELIQEQKATKPKPEPELFDKRPGMLVEFNDKKGVVYNDDPTHEGKLKVIVTDEEYKTEEKLLVAQDKVKVIGYVG